MENRKKKDDGEQKNRAGIHFFPKPNLQSLISNLQSPSFNPIIIKELRSRMRGGRAFGLLTAFLGVLSLVSYGLFRIVESAMRFDASGLVSAAMGQTLFAGLAFLELFLVLFITPSLTAGTISSEYENLTYEMLVATPLKPRAILWGKLVASMSYVLLLIFAAIPLASLVFIFGGVAPADALKALLVLTITALTFGVIGLFCSCLTRRTARATVLSYSFLLLLSVGTLFVYAVWGIIRQGVPPRAVLLLNPFSGMASVLAGAVPQGGRFGIGIPFGALAGEFRDFSDVPPVQDMRPTWHFTVLLYSALSATLYALSTQLVKPIRRWQVGRQGALIVATGLVIFLVAGYALLRPLSTAGSLTTTPTPAPRLIAPARAPAIIERRVLPIPTVPLPTPAAPATEEPGADR